MPKPFRRGLSVAALFAASSLMSTALTAAPPTEQGSGRTELVPLYVSTNRPLAMLTLGDGLPSPVVFDTGTDENILTTRYAAAFGLKVVGESPVIDLGSGKRSTAATVALTDPKLSGVSISSPTAQKLDLDFQDETGIFGPNSFGDRLVILDGHLNRLRIVSRASGLTHFGPGEPYRDNLPSIPIAVQGRTLYAHIDSGNDSELILGGDLLGKVRLKAPAQVVGVARSALGSREVMGGQIDGDVTIGPITLHNPYVSFSPAGEGANIGYPVIRRLNLVLDPANKRSWVLDPQANPARLSEYVGQFGPRTLRVEDGKLIHQREGRPAFELRYLGSDLFEMPATGDRIQFFRRDGRVTKLELITAEGDVVPADRSS